MVLKIEPRALSRLSALPLHSYASKCVLFVSKVKCWGWVLKTTQADHLPHMSMGFVSSNGRKGKLLVKKRPET